jgi:methylmalonyl-CoA mutase cobalamin-binding domain/chain
MSHLQKIVDAIVDLDDTIALNMAEKLIKKGTNPMEILEKCRQGMSIVGDKFESGNFFLSEMIMASEIFNQVMEKIRPQLKKTNTSTMGKIVIGTVEGDIHDIGKNIVIAILEAEGFEVIDLGVDVSPSKFVKAIKEHEPDIVGMSSLLTVALETTKRTVDAIVEAGLRNNVKIIVGGGRINSKAADYIKPDAFSDNAAHGVKLCKAIMSGVEV